MANSDEENKEVKEKSKENVIFFKEFNVIKILERGAFKIWNNLKVGEKVNLKLDEGDHKTILVAFEETTFGELPEKESEIVRKFLKQKWEAFEAIICKRDKKALYDQRFSIAVYIVENTLKEKC